MTTTSGSRARRAYFSERRGRDNKMLTPAQVRQLFAALVADLYDRGDLQEVFGDSCVDAGWTAGTLGSDIAAALLGELGREGLWPFAEHVQAWDDDTLFDVIEFLHDHVSSGDHDTGHHHTFSDCGWHFNNFDHRPAQDHYRAKINAILRRVEPGWELTADGEIIRTAPDGVGSLLHSGQRLLEGTQRAITDAAIAKFRARTSTITDRRDAVRDLADVLEHMRPSVRTHLMTKDERDLFEIANKFWIRHNKPTERREYDHEAWWSWLFYVYLSSIALVTHLEERDRNRDRPDPE